MAGSTLSRTVTLNLISNTTNAEAGLKKIGDQSEGAAKRASAAFGGVLSTLNSTGVLGPFGESLEKIEGMFDQVGEHGKALGKTLMGVGAAGVGVGGILTAAAGPDQAASQQLQQAIENVGGSFDDYKDRIEETVKQNEKFGTTANVTQDAIRILTQGTGDAGKALDLMGEASNLAAAKHEDLSAAANDLVKVYEGKGTKVLTQFGLATADTKTATAALTSATKESQTADDNLANAKQKLADVHAELAGKTTLTVAEQIKLRDAEKGVADDTTKAADAHKKLADAQQGAKDSAKDQTQVLQQLGEKLTGQAAAASDTFTGKLKAMKAEIEDGAAKLGQKYGPALMGVSSGVSLLGGAMEGASAIIGKFKTAQEGAQAATEGLTAAEDAETVSEGLALGPILLIVGAVAAVGAAIYELWQHWGEIWGGIKDIISGVWNWISDHWPLLLGILTGPIGLAVLAIKGHWDDIVGFVEAIPGRIASAASGMWDGISGAFKAAINYIIGIWNDFVGYLKIPGIHVGIGPVHYDWNGVDLGSNLKIPTLDTGGIVTGPTLAMLSANSVPEAVVPLGQGANNLMGSVTINVYPAPGMDENALAAAVQRQMLKTVRSRIGMGLS